MTMNDLRIGAIAALSALTLIPHKATATGVRQ
jgi:hypothetical protein